MTQLATERNTQSQPWLDALRRAALARFSEAGYPSRRDEEWRFTNVDPIAKTKFALAPRIEDASSVEAATQFSFGRDAVTELVFINGHYTPQLSKLGKLPRGVKVQSLAEALSVNPADLKSHLSKHADIKTNAFVALNTGHIRDGAYIHFSRGTTVKGPIHLLFVSVPTAQPSVTHPRVLVIAEENVEATVVESYVGEGSGMYFTNAVTEIAAAPDSRIDHCKLQQESHEAYHLSTMQVHLGRGAHFVSHGTTIGGKLSRNELNVTLAGEYADATCCWTTPPRIARATSCSSMC
jgi:Fe-S cluster assembly protein SufD